MIDEINKETIQRMEKAVQHSKSELLKVRTGRANPQILNSLQVEYYGSKVPITQVATITTPEPRLITLKPYEKLLIAEIEKSIMDSNLGLTPNNNGETVLVPIPPLSEERRKDLIKILKTMGEKSKVSIRNIRREANEEIKKLLKDKKISEDENKNFEKNIQKLTDVNTENIEKISSDKEKEILQI